MKDEITLQWNVVLVKIYSMIPYWNIIATGWKNIKFPLTDVHKQVSIISHVSEMRTAYGTVFVEADKEKHWRDKEDENAIQSLKILGVVNNFHSCRTSESSPGRSQGVRPARPPFERTPGRSTGICFPPHHLAEPLYYWAPSPPSSSARRKCAGAGLEQYNIAGLLTKIWIMFTDKYQHPRPQTSSQ